MEPYPGSFANNLEPENRANLKPRFRKRYVILPVIGLFAITGMISGGDKSDSESFMPDFSGKSTAEAKTKLSDLDIRNSSISFKDLSGTSVGNTDKTIVCKQTPAGGAEITRASKVELVVAASCDPAPQKVEEVKEAPKNVSMPKVIGLTLTKASEEIKSKVGATSEITKKDATTPERSVWDSDNWIVCDQIPAAEGIVTPNGKVDLTYARDATECSTKKVTVSEAEKKSIAESSKATAAGLTEYGARTPCDEWFNSNYGGKAKIHWIVDKRLSDIVDDGYGEIWQFNVGVTLPNEFKGVMICKVTGTDESPVLVDARIN